MSLWPKSVSAFTLGLDGSKLFYLVLTGRRGGRREGRGV